MSQDLDKLFNDGKPVEAGGEVITAAPFKFRQFKAVAAHIAAIWPLLESGDIDVVKLVHEGGAHVTEILAVATNKPAEFIDNLMLDEVIALAVAVFEVNRDFFAERMPGALAGLTNLLPSQETGEQSSQA